MTGVIFLLNFVGIKKKGGGNSDNIFTLKSDLTTTVNGKKCILKAGEYQIANDGKIYFYTKL